MPSPMTQGIVYVAYGKNARTFAIRSIATLRLNNTIPVAVVSDKPLGLFNVKDIYAEDVDPGARWPKLNINRLSPFEYTCYMDADTYAYASINAGFAILKDGWDMAIVPSENQGERLLWHLDNGKELAHTLRAIGNYEPLQLQGGVFFFRKSQAVHDFFAAWREEWECYKDKDQGALLRALKRAPLKVWLLGRPWNGGALVAHHYGQARRTA